MDEEKRETFLVPFLLSVIRGRSFYDDDIAIDYFGQVITCYFEPMIELIKE